MKLADEIACLDQRCMTDIMSAHGEMFDIRKRTENVCKCLLRGDDLISVRRGPLLVGYALVSGSIDDGFTITSLQIDPSVAAISRGLVLRELMNGLMRGFTSYSDDVIVAVETHLKNQPSISLQAKLGFQPIKSLRKDRLRFHQSLGILRERYGIPNQSVVATPTAAR